MSRAIVTLIQQSNRILDTVAPKVKEEANKKITEVKKTLPRKNKIKQMMMDGKPVLNGWLQIPSTVSANVKSESKMMFFEKKEFINQMKNLQ